MGLFDNLFLDQNTPVTINDGVDHSQDAVTQVVDPNTGGGGSSQSGTTGGTGDPHDPKKDTSISDLFESDKKEEAEADATLNPEAPKDVALEIGKHSDAGTESQSTMTPSDSATITPLDTNAIAPADPSALSSTFDIGGDISFDAISESSVSLDTNDGQNSESTGPNIVAIETLPLSGTTDSNSVNLTPQNVPASSDPASLSGTFLSGAPESTIGASGNPTTPENAQGGSATPDAIASSLQDQNAPSAPQIGTSPAIIDIGAVSAPVEGGILDLIGGATPEPSVIPPAAPLAPEPNTPIDLSPSSGIPESPALNVSPVSDLSGSLKNTPTSVASLGSSLGYPDASIAGMGDAVLSTLGTDALALLKGGGQSSTLLREKLYSFIEDLKTLHSRDQTQRYHKLEQIAMYEERIREIEAEAANRKRVLQAEIDDLKRQIEMMDREKNDIQGVISTFQKEVSSS